MAKCPICRTDIEIIRPGNSIQCCIPFCENSGHHLKCGHYICQMCFDNIQSPQELQNNEYQRSVYDREITTTNLTNLSNLPNLYWSEERELYEHTTYFGISHLSTDNLLRIINLSTLYFEFARFASTAENEINRRTRFFTNSFSDSSTDSNTSPNITPRPNLNSSLRNPSPNNSSPRRSPRIFISR
jgi:hypothetical protein